MSSPELPVTRKVLRWAREVSGFSVEEVATKLEQVSKRITAETVESWEDEDGEALPRLTALRKLAQLYKRPMAVFFLNEPPWETPPPKNFRLLAMGEARPLSPDMILAVRSARRLHELAEEVSDELGYDLRAELPQVDVSSKPAELAATCMLSARSVAEERRT